MFKNYIKIAWRNLVKDSQFTFLNVVGLSTGLACTLLIYLWVSDEWKMDRFNKKDGQLYQVMENRKQASGIWTAQTTSGLMADALANDMPEVQYAVNTASENNAILSVDDEKNIRADGLYAGHAINAIMVGYGHQGESLINKVVDELRCGPASVTVRGVHMQVDRGVGG